ncbi:T9SS C-terminal target domain-containing protein [Chryseobacterium arthrosphaerae]|uniref:T9SS-dependent choice-of-anchor J family protein n=1 Tax=Chryseobacterium arthrosphaerae TaxID=651561 RepID=UPI000F4ECA1C|nr:T9SS type A sorting domain-containing protein [Chryseobacterium arthrosphaerae]AYZ12851.1 T9SS C-terminal target domain-containing protein [Chryseobacterium arthrosphaerae]
MKKLLFFVINLLLIDHYNAQTIIFEETFETSPIFQIPLNWEAINRSNTFPTWNTMDLSPFTNAFGFDGKVANITTMNPASDQLLVSPSVNLQTGNMYSLKFLIGTFTSNHVFPPQGHYAVYILPSGTTFTGSETPVLEEDIVNGDIAELKTLDISGYSGQNIKIYFRQFNSTGITQLLLDTVQISEEPLLGTSEESLTSEDLIIYPNPANDYVHLKSKSKISQVKIFDLTGREIMTKPESDRIDIDHLQSGTYIINVTTDHKTYNKKLIKK